MVLCGRHASRDAACDAVAELEREGCAVTVIAADVSRENDVARLLDEIGDSDLPPLKGIVHTAGVDAVVPFHELEHEELYRTLAAKVYGGWLLDRLTTERGIELSLFVCTSSIASVWGSVSQGAYSAANAFLDALVEQRAAQGKAATAVNYGPWSGVGMGAMNAEGVAWLRSRGIRALDPDFAIDAMEHLAAGNVTRAVLADVNWSMFRELAELRRPRPFLERLGGQETDLQADASGPTVLVTELTAAAADERDEILVRAIKLELAAVLQTPVDELREDLGFFDLGMDSLMAVEFRNALAKRLGRKLPATVVMDRPDIGAITAYILADILALAAGEEQARAGTVDRTEDEVGELSSTEVATALEEELKDILGGGDKGRRDE